MGLAPWLRLAQALGLALWLLLAQALGLALWLRLAQALGLGRWLLLVAQQVTRLQMRPRAERHGTLAQLQARREGRLRAALPGGIGGSTPSEDNIT